ncbi:MAG TPA: tetratricopeptide repeat protein [Planctomicrobium sp.]|nr:tetratricopeptide repeat protein [Planctomicrobium sp.]
MPDNSRALIKRPGYGAIAALFLPGLLTVLLTMESGCGSLRTSRSDAVRKELDSNPKYSIGGIQGPTERALSQAKWDRKREDLARGADPETAAALETFDHAQALYDQEKYKEAEVAFKKLGKERRSRYESFGARFRRTWGMEDARVQDLYGTYGDAIEEDALFMTAESQFARQRYSDAQESYEDLLVRYPSTRYLDTVTRRMFHIARYWLDIPTNYDSSGAQADENHALAENGRQPSSLSRLPVFPNLTDKSRPLFDTYGRGKQALRSIWMHDSTGPLAADALMLAANHALRTEDYVESKRLYSLLREQYPDSTHLKDAYLLGSHVTLASYQGPAYDGESLSDAKKLKQEMLALFPGLSEDERSRIQEEVDQLKHAEVERTWDLVDFYRAKRNNTSAKFHCYLIINKYPDSPFADHARNMLVQIQEEDESWANSVWNFRKTQPSPTVIPTAPKVATPQVPKGRTQLPDSSGSPDRGSSREAQGEPAAPPQPLPQNMTEPKKPGFFERLNPLRKVEEPPQLEKPPQRGRENLSPPEGELAGFER